MHGLTTNDSSFHCKQLYQNIWKFIVHFSQQKEIKLTTNESYRLQIKFWKSLSDTDISNGVLLMQQTGHL